MKQKQLAVSKNNIVWLIVIIVVGVVAWQAFGWIAGLVAAAAGLAASEVVERKRRAQRNAGS